MLHPLTWPSVPKFCPMGCTAADSLTQDLSPEQSADILLLGCDDPYQILYTIYADVTVPPTPRKIVITCCDVEPAVLARNIILFTLLEDSVPSTTVWEVFYHFRISTHVAGVLAAHASKLVKLSETCETWRESKYGSFVKFVDSNLLFELRRLWTFYADFPNISTIQSDKLEHERTLITSWLLDRLASTPNYNASRSATVARADVWESVSDQYGQYWKNGTTATTTKEIKKATHLNSTFCYSQAYGETFHGVSYTTFPQSFHFASAFVPIEIDPVGSNVTSAMAKAKQQFKASCLALEASRKAGALTLRFFVGDALALCKALNMYARLGNPKTELFSAPWRAAPINLTEHKASVPEAPILFDIIDTSTLADTLGVLNILLVTQPLLKKQPESQAVVYTDLKLDTRSAINRFTVLELCSDVPKIGILFGLVPRPYVSLFTSRSNTHELIPRSDYCGFTERVAWVDPTSGDKNAYKEPKPTVCINEMELLKMIGGLHHGMFPCQDISSEIALTDLDPHQLGLFSSPHYTCETVADLLLHLQSRIRVSNAFLPKLMMTFAFLTTDLDSENSLDSSNVAETSTQCRLRGLSLYEPEEPLAPTGVFRGWHDIPREACVVLTVPSEALNVLRDDREELSPRLICTIWNDSEDHQCSAFSCLHATWGTCVSLDESHNRFTIKEDLDGIRGRSNLIVSFWVGSDALTSQDLRISFALKYTPLASVHYHRKLGLELNLYTTMINDRDHVLVLRERPMGQSQTQQTPGYSVSAPLTSLTNATIRHRITAFDDGLELAMWPCHLIETEIDVESEAEKAALIAGAQVMTTQIGPCTLFISIRGVERIVTFPYPVNGAQVKGHVDNRTHQIYLTTPPLKVIETGGYPTDFFPLLQHASYSPWNLHHVHLDRMPKLDVRISARNPDKSWWLANHASSQMSDRERIVRHCTSPLKRQASDVLVNIKDAVSTLIMVYAGFRYSQRTVFTLCEPSYGVYMAICVGGIRLDLAAATVVLDTAIVAWPSKIAELLDPQTPIHEIQTPISSVNTWKRLLAACVERCRTWSHGPKCEYKSTNGAPCLGGAEDNLLCSCGQGLGLEPTGWKIAGWERLLPYSTRAAIPPLFGVVYLEEIVGPGLKLQNEPQPISWDEPEDECWECGEMTEDLIECSRCMKARYCSQDCRLEHWQAEHKYICKPPDNLGGQTPIFSNAGLA